MVEQNKLNNLQVALTYITEGLWSAIYEDDRYKVVCEHCQVRCPVTFRPNDKPNSLANLTKHYNSSLCKITRAGFEVMALAAGGDEDAVDGEDKRYASIMVLLFYS